MRDRRRKSEYLRLQRSREVRLWIATVVGSGVAIVNYMETHPEFKNKLRDKWDAFANRYRKNPKIRVDLPNKNN